jgi:putative PEP-CTERM system histidine kinase
MEFLDTFGTIGYAVAAMLFLLLGVLLLTCWRGRMQGALLVTALFVSALWAAVLAAQAAWHTTDMATIWGLEVLRNLGWLAFLGRLLDLQLQGTPTQQRTLRLGLSVILGVGALFIVPTEAWLSQLPWFSDLDWATVRLAVQMSLAITGLALVEQVFRNTPWQHRWGVKFLCLSTGSLFAFDFFLFANALLFKRLDGDIWLARGGATALAVPLLAVAAARNPQWSFDLFLSRKFVFHSAAFVAAGVYLLLMSLAGYYIRYYGGAWSSAIQAAFFFGAGLVLVVLLFSGRIRARTKVFISKHFFRDRYDYREEWLHLISVLSGKVLEAPLPERIIFALSELVDSPGGALWVCTEGGVCDYERSWNLPDVLIAKDRVPSDLTDFLSRRGWVLDLSEYKRNPDGYEGLAVPPWMLESDNLSLVVPLIHVDALLGFVVLARPRSPQTIDWEITDMLKVAARQAASYLALDGAARALAEAEQFAGFNRLSAFVVHDLKNLIAQLSLVARNGERHKTNPAFVDDMLVTVQNSVDKMTRLLAQLRGALPGRTLGDVDLCRLVRDVVAERQGQEPRPRLIDVPATPCTLCVDHDRLGSVLGHIVQNAQEATRRDGTVTVCLSVANGEAVIVVADTGSGMDAGFIRERLFKPFDTTKGLSGMGIGAYECREFIRSLGGSIAVHSTPGAGTQFAITIPLGARDGVPPSPQVSMEPG